MHYESFHVNHLALAPGPVCACPVEIEFAHVLRSVWYSQVSSGVAEDFVVLLFDSQHSEKE